MSTENKMTALKADKAIEKVIESTDQVSKSIVSTLSDVKTNVIDLANTAATAGAQETIALVEQITPKMTSALNATGDYVYDIQQRISGELTTRVRTQPMMSIGIAALVGFAISRYIKTK